MSQNATPSDELTASEGPVVRSADFAKRLPPNDVPLPGMGGTLERSDATLRPPNQTIRLSANRPLVDQVFGQRPVR